jgi:hypothetical protein
VGSACRSAVVLVALGKCSLWLRINVCTGVICFFLALGSLPLHPLLSWLPNAGSVGKKAEIRTSSLGTKGPKTRNGGLLPEAALLDGSLR